MLQRKKSKVVVITGASAGIGRATAREFAKQGATVALLARSRDGLEGARKDVEELGGRAFPFPTDVSDPEQVEAAAAEIERAVGPIDVWVNCAMTAVFAPIKETTAAEFKRVTEVTYLGYVHGTLAALKRMLPRDRGVIVQVGSALAYRAIPLQATYCAAKHAMKGFTESLRTELMHDKSRVKVTMVHLPGMNTPQFNWVKCKLPNKPQPVPPIYQPEVAARGIIHASMHPRKREYYVGYPTYKTIWGEKFAPGFADWYLSKKGYSSQQTDQPVSPNRPSNLWEPVPGDHGAHGDFDSRSRSFSYTLWFSMNRGWIASALAGIGLIALAGTPAASRRLERFSVRDRSKTAA